MNESNPAAKLQVSSEDNEAVRLFRSGAGWSYIATYRGTARQGVVGDLSVNGWGLWADAGVPLVFVTNGGGSRTVISPNGNVGIGTTTPITNPNVPQSGLEINSANTAAIWLSGTGPGGATIRGRNINAGGTATNANDFLLAIGGLGYDGTAYADFNKASINFTASENWSSGHQGTYITFNTTANATTSRLERMRIDNAGNVGINTASPTEKLTVAGNVSVAGNITATGTITGATVIGAVYQDVAEWVPATTKMEPGTVVVLNPEHNNEVKPSEEAYDTRVAGVVSANPGVILGKGSDSKAMIATTGRVRVRVDADKHPIHVGDLLVTSDASGTAMVSEPMVINGRKFHQPGTVIGKALEPLASGRGEILVLLSLQ